MRGLARGRQRGVTFGESEGELHGVSCGDFDLRVLLTWHFLQSRCWSLG